MNLVPEQIEAIEMIKMNGLSVISGPPGSGKTTLIKNAIIGNTLLLAPTGAAAWRISKSTGLPAHTIDSVWYYPDLIKNNKGCSVIIDEASMVDSDKADQVMTALQPKRICFVGDERQLPCVKGKSILSTLLRISSIPRVYFTMNHRQADLSSSLVKTLHALGTPGFTMPFEGNSLKVIYGISDEDCIQKAVTIYSSNPAMQMLGMKNDVVVRLNILTKDFEQRIICVKNLKDGKKNMLVANGIMGTKEAKVIRYENGYNDILKDGKFKTMFMDARAITVHLSQGNEFSEFGLIVITENKKYAITANMMNTALSRFKTGLFVIGTQAAIRKAFSGKFVTEPDEDVVAEMEAGNHKRSRIIEEEEEELK